MKGTVIKVNRAHTRVAVSTDNGISLIETRGAPLNVGDELDGELERLGTQTAVWARGRIEIFVDDIERTAVEAVRWVSK